MSENGENIESSALDNRLNVPVEANQPVPEKYEPSGKHGENVADKANPPSDQEPSKLTSWTMREIERELSQTTLKPSRTKVEQFTINQHRRSDLRMRNLSRQFGMVLRREHQKEMVSGPVENRVREFDIKSQTMRMITSNAAMGTLQFQKTMVLPYMRKNLALGYQKVAILKEISGGISSMEKAIVSKLEAIKINTAGAVPRKQGYFKKLFEDVGFLNRRRIAQNISNYQMDGIDNLYQEYVAPRTRKLKGMMEDTSAGGGVNALKRNITGKVNRLRRSVRDISEQDTTDTTAFNKFKVAGARRTKNVLDFVVKRGAKFRLNPEKNKAWAELLQKPTSDLARFNPFGIPGNNAFDPDGDDIPTSSKGNNKVSDKLTSSFTAWRKEYRTDQDKALEHLANISDKIACCCEDAGVKTTRKTKARKTTPIRQTTKTKEPSVDMESDVSEVPTKDAEVPKQRRSFLSRLVSAFGGSSAKETLPISERVSSDTMNPLTMERMEPSKLNPTGFQIEGNITKSLEGTTTPFVPKPIGESSFTLAPDKTSEKLPFTSHIDMFKLQQSTKNLQNEADLDRKFVAGLFENLGDKVLSVTQTVKEGNQQRSKFEMIQTKWKQMADRLSNQKNRKNSYEDIQAQKEKDRDRKGLLSRAADRVKRTALGVAGNLAEGNAVGAITSAGGQALDWVKDAASDAVGDFVSDKADDVLDKAKNKGSRTLRKAKIMRSARGRRLARSVGRSSIASAATSAAESITEKSVKKSLMSKAGRAILDGSKYVAAGAGNMALGGVKSLGGKALSLAGKGALGIAKGLGPGLVVGLAADAAGGWLDKNTTGVTNRLGKTAATAASWGATGAGLGSIVPIVGTATGGAIGAGLGALYENADLVKKALAFITNKQFDIMEGVGGAAGFMWKNLFGSDPKFDKLGRVTEKETPSILGHVKTLFFGRDAKYAKSGDIVLAGKTGIFPELRRGFDLFFFGVKDPKEKNKFKPESSMFSQLTTSFLDTLEAFKKGMSELPGKLLDGLKGLSPTMNGLATGAGNVVQGVQDWWAGSAADSKDVYNGKGTPVGDAKAIVESLIPGVIVTSSRRPAGRAGNAGKDSWHVKSNAAVDVAPVKGMSFGQFKKIFTDAGYSLIEAIDETKPETMKKTGATGPHWHLVLGNRTDVPSSPYTVTPGSQAKQAPGKGSMVIQTGKTNPYAWDSDLGAPKMPSNPAAPNYASGTGAGTVGKASKSSKELFNTAVNYLSGSKGYTKNAAVGIAANLYGESQLNPLAFNSLGGGQGAKGIAQWRGDRITDIEQRWGKSIHQMNLKEQLDAVDMELKDGKHVAQSRAITKGTEPIVSVLNSAPNVEAVIQQMVHRYERPSKYVGDLEAETRRRIQIAQSLSGGMGTNAPKPPEKKAASPAQQAQATPKSKPAQAQTKPANTPAPKAAPKQEENTFLSKAASVMDKMGEFFTGDKNSSKSKGNTVIAPITTNNNNVWPTTTPTTMSMLKTSVRTGN